MIEIIVSLALLSTSMLAVFGVLRANLSASTQSSFLTRSVLLAESLMSEVILQNNIAFETKEGSNGLFDWKLQIAPTDMDNLAAIYIQISWQQQQRQQHYQLCYLKHIKPAFQGS